MQSKSRARAVLMADVAAAAGAAMLICMQITGAHFSGEDVLWLIKPGESCMMHQKLATAVYKHLRAAWCNESMKGPESAIKNAKSDKASGNMNTRKSRHPKTDSSHPQYREATDSYFSGTVHTAHLSVIVKAVRW